MANQKAFTRTKAMLDGIKPHPFTQMQSRALKGWGENVQPPRPYGYFTGAKGPLDRSTIAGGIKTQPIANMAETLPLGPVKKI